MKPRPLIAVDGRGDNNNESKHVNSTPNIAGRQRLSLYGRCAGCHAARPDRGAVVFCRDEAPTTGVWICRACGDRCPHSPDLQLRVSAALGRIKTLPRVAEVTGRSVHSPAALRLAPEFAGAVHAARGA